MAIKIITDSTAYLNQDYLNKYNIEVLSLIVNFEDESFREIDITNPKFYEKMEKEGIPTSSQPNISEMLKKMEAIIANGDDLIGVFISSAMSGTYQSANMCKEQLLETYPDANIEIIDSKTNSMQLGYCVLEGAKASKDKSFVEVVEIIKHTIKASRFIFIPDNLDYLHKGGRIGGAQTLFGNMFKITPILTVVDKEANVLKTVRTKKRAVKTLIEQMLLDHQKYQVLEITVHHINAINEAKALLNTLKTLIDVKIEIADIGPVIGVHVGPKAIGLAYHTKKAIID